MKANHDTIKLNGPDCLPDGSKPRFKFEVTGVGAGVLADAIAAAKVLLVASITKPEGPEFDAWCALQGLEDRLYALVPTEEMMDERFARVLPLATRAVFQQ